MQSAHIVTHHGGVFDDVGSLSTTHHVVMSHLCPCCHIAGVGAVTHVIVLPSSLVWVSEGNGDQAMVRSEHAGQRREIACTPASE